MIYWQAKKNSISCKIIFQKPKLKTKPLIPVSQNSNKAIKALLKCELNYINNRKELHV